MYASIIKLLELLYITMTEYENGEIRLDFCSNCKA